MSTYCIYAPTGRIDASNAGVCERDLLALMEATGPSAIIDLSGLSYISSAGLRVLLVGAKAARAKGGKAVICHAPAAIAEVLKMSGFDKVIPLLADRATAQAQLGG
jgi:anti-sigma B factor antagonist